MLISDAYREQNKRLHQTNAHYGTSGMRWAPFIDRLVREEGYSSILDYGAGKQTLANALPHLPIKGYDPAMPGLDKQPEPADLVVCTDVLEHVEPERINSVIRHLAKVTRRKLFFSIATAPSKKTLADGRNAHLIVRQHDWWRHKLSLCFQVLLWEVREGLVYGEAFPRAVGTRKKFRRPTKRRPVTPPMQAMFDHIRRQAAKYQDALTQIDTIRMFEGVGDEPADMHVVYDLLEHWPDPDDALLEICRLSRVAVMVVVKLGDGRTEGDWRKILERRLRIAEMHREGNQLSVMGSPMVGVTGVTATGAVGDDLLWEPVQAAMKRFSRRIETAPAHGRRAILACYGPSLKATIETLRADIGPNTDVVSVSGAHDFLLSHGIVPRYHVECDPRAHKADNIDAVSPGTTYLLASSVHPVLFDKLGADADIRLWHVATAGHAARLVDEHGENPRHIIFGGGSVGLRSVPLLYAMGYRDFHIYGMDCSFSDDGAEQWAGKHAGKRQDLQQIRCDDRIFTSSAILATYATDFWELVQKMRDVNIRLYGDGLLQAMARYYMGVPQTAHVNAKED